MILCSFCYRHSDSRIKCSLPHLYVQLCQCNAPFRQFHFTFYLDLMPKTNVLRSRLNNRLYSAALSSNATGKCTPPRPATTQHTAMFVEEVSVLTQCFLY